MNQNIELSDWIWSLQDAMWWNDMHPDHAILLYQYTKQAHDKGLTYYVKNPMSGEFVELTKIYEQFKLLATLKAEYK